MCLSLYDYQSRASRCSNELTSLKNSVTTNQKHTIGSQKPKRRELKHSTKENHQTTKGKKKGTKKEYKIIWKIRFQMAINSRLAIIALNANGLYSVI